MVSLKKKLVAQLEKVPGIEHVPYPDRDDGFSGLNFQGKEIAHFHNFNELDLKLGKKLIKREGLTHYSDSINHPNRGANSQYIELRFNNQAELNEVVRLVKLLIAERTT
jgi:hypothetical protein